MIEGFNSKNYSSSNIQVAIRVRPLLENEKSQGHQSSTISIKENQEIKVRSNLEDAYRQIECQYKFNKVFTPQHTQNDIYKQLKIKSLVKSVLDGYHGTIFAYGQTGSGKTHTMEGINNEMGAIDDQVGIIPRIISDTFKLARQKQSSKHITLFCSFLQIYNEKVYDLLNESHSKVDTPGLRIRWTKQDQFQVENLFVFECDNEKQMLDLYHQGIKNRVIAAHTLNQTSSRSHAMFTITAESTTKDNLKEVTVSKLQLVDLAGSEKQQYHNGKVLNNRKIHYKESIQINKSLFALRKQNTHTHTMSYQSTFESQSPNYNQFIPYRDSKLTSLLKQSLGGNALTIMIACINPSDLYFDENISTLKYAAQAQRICNKPVINVDEKVLLIKDLKEKIRILQEELKNANDHIAFLSSLQHVSAKRFGSQFLGEQHQNVIVNEKKVVTPHDIKDIILINAKQSVAQEEAPYKNNKFQDVKFGGLQIQGAENLEQLLSKTNDQLKMNDYLNQLISKVTELLQSNNQLRDTIDKISKEKEELEQKYFQSNLENENLVLKFEQIGRLTAFEVSKTTPPSRQSLHPSNFSLAKSNLSLYEDQNEIRQLKNKNSELLTLNEKLEQQNQILLVELQSQGSGNRMKDNIDLQFYRNYNSCQPSQYYLSSSQSNELYESQYIFASIERTSSPAKMSNNFLSHFKIAGESTISTHKSENKKNLKLSRQQMSSPSPKKSKGSTVSQTSVKKKVKKEFNKVQNNFAGKQKQVNNKYLNILPNMQYE